MNAASPGGEVAVVVGGGPGISSSCAKLFIGNGMRVAIAARKPEKPALKALEAEGARLYACDASIAEEVGQLFKNIVDDIGAPRLVVHNIDGRTPAIFRKAITEAEAELVYDTIRNAAFSAFLVG